MAKKNPKVEAAIERLKVFHRLGRLAAKKTQSSGQNRKLAAFAQGQGYSVAHVHNAIRFCTLYSRDQLQALCTEMRRTNSALGIGHIRELIQVPKTADRKSLQQEALKHGWSVRKLQAIRLARFPANRKKDRTGNDDDKKRRRRGRLPRRPSSVEEAYDTIADRAESLCKFADVIRFRAEDEEELTLDENIQTQLKNVVGRLKKLADGIWVIRVVQTATKGGKSKPPKKRDSKSSKKRGKREASKASSHAKRGAKHTRRRRK